MDNVREYIQTITVLDALANPALGKMRAGYQDDLCDCAFVNVWEWKNPYTATTLRFRFCCWLTEQRVRYGNLFEELPGYHDAASEQLVTDCRVWDGEEDMPRHLFYRQMARKTGRPLAEVRREYRDQPTPKGTGKRDA